MKATVYSRYRVVGGFIGLLVLVAGCTAQSPPLGDPLDHEPGEEGYYYQRITLPIPDDVVLEVGGLTVLDDGRPAVATRRGDIWLVENAYAPSYDDGGELPRFIRFARGLHEPLGVVQKDGALYSSQRAELTRLVDEDGDDRADRFETVYAWPLSGNYHEYAFGPLVLPDGDFFVSLNLAWIGYMASPVKWRGWGIRITEEGTMRPMVVGFRSPAGLGMTAEGDILYAENQGDWIGSGWMTHLEEGDFVGHPSGLVWTGEPESPVSVRREDVPDNGEPMYVAKRNIPQLKLPAIWFPYTIMGISTSDILLDDTEGRFGPFAGHLFVGDQGHSKVMRVFLERVNGALQGAVFPFYEGFVSGAMRLAWGEDGSMFVGQTSRGWSATGAAPYGLERLAWTGNVPFEMKEIRARPDGFAVTFTRPVDREQAADPTRYALSSFIYRYHSTYGSPAVDIEVPEVTAAEVSEDGLTVELTVAGLRPFHVHEFRLGELASEDGEPLLHDLAYYTLNEIPDGEEAVAGGAAEGDDATPVAAVGTKHVTETPGGWNQGPELTIQLGTVPGLQYDTREFKVPAGARVALTFVNSDDMLHNVVITRPDVVDEVASAAMNLGIRGQAMGYVPESSDVLFYTSLLQPGTEETIYFTAPEAPGAYPFVCTFPGHSMTMRGVMQVTSSRPS